MTWWLARGETSLPDGEEWLSPVETARAAALRFPKRRTEYLLRRLAGKHAASLVLGRSLEPAALAGVEVLNAADGSPYLLVNGAAPGFDVSLADRAGWAVCVVGRRAGCDLELVEPRSPAFVRDYLTAAEQRLAAGDELAANLIWSAKESALKVLRTGLRRDTRSVEVTPDPAGGDGWGALGVRVAGGPPLTGWWRREGAFVITVVTPAPDVPPIHLDRRGALATAAPRHSWLSSPAPGPPRDPGGAARR
ncbi:4'-phosphopantetheinyl transferase family protein [Nucisporomicrobium flavum]|uniref:4'-phosphopantetheinyl transferase family protein n=1 Tax=Nucisporomicrobium flavum TaxID=2785915 RepID=UPI003C2C8585